MTQPPAAPTLHPKRCETCQSHLISGLEDSCPNEDFCERTGCTISQIVLSWIEIHGCASHSSTPDADARQPRKCYDVNVCAFCTNVSCRCNGCISPTKAHERIADVVKQLEARKSNDETERQKIRGWPGSHQLFGYISYDEAIALLKDGVERK